METVLIAIILLLLLLILFLEHVHCERINEEIAYWSKEAKRSYRRGFNDAMDAYLESQITINTLEE
jgi:hypothetical protein